MHVRICVGPSLFNSTGNSFAASAASAEVYALLSVILVQTVVRTNTLLVGQLIH